MDGDRFLGPVFHILTPGPVEYALRIFTNTGEFVAEGQGRIGEADLPLLARKGDAGGTRYLARIVWSGLSQRGVLAGTGAYVLVATLNAPRDLKTGAPAHSQVSRIRFGMLRGR
jgi:hypothetical protein